VDEVVVELEVVDELVDELEVTLPLQQQTPLPQPSLKPLQDKLLLKQTLPEQPVKPGK
jgi:hypothetical protein